jgi:hypothetical protein
MNPEEEQQPSGRYPEIGGKEDMQLHSSLTRQILFCVVTLRIGWTTCQ